jgi:ABC-type dipeptide/oligopeptide/nickel transport system permease component
MGTTEPIVQFVKWVSHVVRGDFGRSFQDRRPVMEDRRRIPNTLYLNAALVLDLPGILSMWAPPTGRFRTTWCVSPPYW